MVYQYRMVFNEYFCKYLVKLFNGYIIVAGFSTKFRLFLGNFSQCNSTKKLQKYTLNTSLYQYDAT